MNPQKQFLQMRLKSTCLLTVHTEKLLVGPSHNDHPSILTEGGSDLPPAGNRDRLVLQKAPVIQPMV